MLTLKSSHHPDGIFTCFALALAPMGRLLTSLPRLTIEQLRPTLRSTTGCTCRNDIESSHRPDGKNADVLALISRLHNCESRFGQLQDVREAETFKSSHRPDGKIADVLALTLA